MADLTSAALLQTAQREFQRSNMARAKRLCLELLQSDRRNVSALDLLAQVSLAYGFYDEAVSYCRKCVTLAPKEPRPHLLIGRIQTTQGRFREAIAHYDKALRQEPGNRDAVAGKAEVNEKRGQHDRARRLLAPFFESGNANTEMAVIQARLDLHEKRYDDAIALAERFAPSDDGRAGGSQAQLLFLAAKCQERKGDYGSAFETYVRGNAGLGGSFEPEAWINHTDELIRAYSPEAVAALPRAAESGVKPIFIIGMPRSGSTLVETIIDAHPDAHGVGEFAAMQEMVNALPLLINSSLPYPECVSDIIPDDVDKLARRYLAAVTTTNRRAKRFVDKYLASYRHLGLIDLLFPDARVIHTQRDPVDTCLSCFAETLPVVLHPYSTDLEHLALVYQEYERLMAHWQSVTRVPIMHVPYEKLVGDQEGLSREVLAFCDLTWNDKCLRFHESGRVANTLSYDQVKQPIYNTSVGRAERFGHHLDGLRQSLSGLAGAAGSDPRENGA